MEKLEFAEKHRIIQDDIWCFPYDITLKILFLLPLKSLAKLKLLSKSWYFQISSPKFANFLIQFSNFITPQTLIFQSKNCISSLKSEDLNKIEINTTLLDHPFPDSRTGVYYYCAGSYNGVVCIHITTPDLQEQLIVWNPVTRECRPIPLPPPRVDDPPITPVSCRHKRYWFGFVYLLDDVVIFHLKRKRSYLYSMKDSSWRELMYSNRFIIEYETIPCRSLGTRFVLKDGVLHYAVGLYSIFKFDLVNETLSSVRHLEQRLSVDNKNYRMIDVALGVTQENSLCSGRVFQHWRKDKWVLEIWNLVERTNSSSWKKLYRISLGNETPRPYPWVIGFTYQGKIFVGGEKLVIVDPNRVASDNMQEVKTKHTAIYTMSYVQTLLSPYSLHNLEYL